MSKVLFVGAAVCAIASCWGAAAQAQTAPAKATAVGEVIVTAERREASSQKVSIALTVLSGKTLQKENVVTVNDLANASPNLEVEPAFGGGQPEFRIRGVGFQDYASNNAPTVGVYVNEVAYPIPIMTEGAFYDVSRIEVLRGPQGTLYGRNTTGGAVNVITNQPTSTFHSGFDAEYSSYNDTHVEGYVSGPIAPDLTARLAAFTDQGGAYQYNQFTGQKFGNADRFGERLMLNWNPTAKLDVKFEFHALQDHSDGDGLYIFTPSTPAQVLASGFDYLTSPSRFATSWALDPAFAKDIGISPNTAPFRHSQQYGASLNIRYDLGGADLVNILSYDYMDRQEFQDWAPGLVANADVYFHSKPQVVSDELRLMSNGNGPLSWITGVYYSHQDLNEAYLSDFTPFAGEVHYDQKVDSIAGFGQATYKLTDQINLIGGLRIEHETREMDDFDNIFLFGAIPVGGVGLLPNVSTSMTPLTGKVAAEYRPLTDLMLYASISKGVKSGGFTTYNTGAASGISPFKPETLWAYEAGFKWTLPDHIHLNASAFHYDYTDEQVLGAIFTGGTPIGHFLNVPRSHIDGVEAEVSGEVLPHLNISQTVGYKVGTYDSFANYATPGGVLANLSHTNIPFPRASYEGDVSYWVAVAGDYKLEGDVNYSFHDTYPSWLDRINPGVSYKLPSYWLSNASLTLSPAHGAWTFGLFLDNAFDTQYDLTRNFFIPNANIADPGRPRTIGARVTANF